jgi:hypothetical protein
VGLVAGSIADAGAVLCARKNGALSVRQSCKKKESQVTSNELGLETGQGPAGPKGDKGDKGDRGDRGDIGPSNALYRNFPTAAFHSCVLGVVPEHVGATTVIPAGSYVVAAQVYVFSGLSNLANPPGPVTTIFRCRLFANDAPIAGGALTLNRYDVGPFPMVGAAQSDGDITLEIRCSHDAGGCGDVNDFRFDMESQAITATRIGSFQ